ncbi:ArnT family glycosyltransferase [Candidatus Magnetomonas plexicatena]|uniref:ArnT family glycosyltransferase n=1 Tax=Candidatus Magnetomonas plexicatena TaxID=2552947 RepID=UPI0011004698|nr:hypothetical protein E2O03_003075 [Nitrospirales bacterium LBB_01]
MRLLFFKIALKYVNINRMVQQRNLRRLLIVTLALTSVFLVFSWIRIIFLFPINPDGGCYLSVTERIYDGLRPYTDISINYPPVSYYCYLIVRKLFGGGDALYRLVLLIVEAASAFVLAAIVKRFFKSTTVATCSGVVFLFFYLAYDGPWFVMEPFVNLFSLSAVYFLLNPTLIGAFASGVCLMLSVMSKQYGFLILPVLSAMLFIKDTGFDKKGGLLRTLFFAFGFFTAALTLVYFLHLNVTSFISQISGQGYVKAGVLNMLTGIFSVRGVWIIGVLALSVIMLLKKYDFYLLIFSVLCLFHITPLYVRTYAHYFQLCLPYAVILLAYIVKRLFFDEHFQGKRREALAAVLVVTLMGPVSAAVYVPLRYAMSITEKNEILLIAKEINTIVPQRSPALVVNATEFYYYCNLYPPTKEEGYHVIYKSGDFGNPFNYKMETIHYVLWFDGDMIKLQDSRFENYLRLTHKRLKLLKFHDGKRTVEIWGKLDIKTEP